MDNWDEVRTAYHVARIGTVSGAAEALGVHHATVIRHVDALEERLGTKLFQRHPRGYTATEAGADLLRVAQTTDDQFTQLAGRIKGLGAGVSGDLVITSLGTMASLVVPALVDYQQLHPEVNLRFLTGERLFRLEYGEAHVAIRAGTKPDQPDNVVQPFVRQTMALVASDDYIARHGKPASLDDLAQHYFVGHDDETNRAPFNRWLTRTIDRSRITFRASENRILKEAIIAGAGIGFVTNTELATEPRLHEMLPSLEEWSAQLWLVTHVDLHRTAKVQSVLAFLKDRATTWTP